MHQGYSFKVGIRFYFELDSVDNKKKGEERRVTK